MEEICHCYFGHQPTALLVNSLGYEFEISTRSRKQRPTAWAAVLLPWALFFPEPTVVPASKICEKNSTSPRS